MKWNNHCIINDNQILSLAALHCCSNCCWRIPLSRGFHAHGIESTVRVRTGSRSINGSVGDRIRQTAGAKVRSRLLIVQFVCRLQSVRLTSSLSRFVILPVFGALLCDCITRIESTKPRRENPVRAQFHGVCGTTSCRHLANAILCVDFAVWVRGEKESSVHVRQSVDWPAGTGSFLLEV